MYTTDKILGLSCLILVKFWHIWALQTCILSEQHNHAKKSLFSFDKWFVHSYWVCTGHGTLGKSWNSKMLFSRPDKSWTSIGGHIKS